MQNSERLHTDESCVHKHLERVFLLVVQIVSDIKGCKTASKQKPGVHSSGSRGMTKGVDYGTGGTNSVAEVTESLSDTLLNNWGHKCFTLLREGVTVAVQIYALVGKVRQASDTETIPI
jgi:hypothetical protein